MVKIVLKFKQQGQQQASSVSITVPTTAFVRRVLSIHDTNTRDYFHGLNGKQQSGMLCGMICGQPINTGTGVTATIATCIWVCETTTPRKDCVCEDQAKEKTGDALDRHQAAMDQYNIVRRNWEANNPDSVKRTVLKKLDKLQAIQAKILNLKLDNTVSPKEVATAI